MSWKDIPPAVPTIDTGDRDREPNVRDSWTDAREIREVFGIPAFYRLKNSLEDYEHPLPNTIVHEAEPDEFDYRGGTNWLAVGEKGSGKSTLGMWTATHLMDENDEAVVWRGSQSRSEWLPLAPWTTLLLPAGADIDARWKPRDIREDAGGEPATLTDIVRDVEFYDGLEDLLSKLEPHQFHVVYPDPAFRGCNEIMDRSNYAQDEIEYIPQSAGRSDPDLNPTPVVHWWVAFAVARLEYGPYDWTSLIFDEAADLMPDSAKADKHQTYEKVKALRAVMADSRKYYFSLYWFAHHEENLHSKIRRTVQWRVSMPDGTANPCQNNNDRPPVGFSQIPMVYDMQSRKNIGYGIVWTETNWTRFTWDDIALADDSRWLKIGVADGGGESGAGQRARTKESAAAAARGGD